MAVTKKRPTLDREQWYAIADTCPRDTWSGRRDRAMILLMYRCGLRVGELVNLRLADLDLRKMELEVPDEGKTGSRTLGIPDSHKLVSALTEWLDVRGEKADSAYLFHTYNGKPLDRGHMNRTLSRRSKRAGIEEHVNPHMARHSFATERLRRGDDVTLVQKMLGHTSMKTTLVYLHGNHVEAIERMKEADE